MILIFDLNHVAYRCLFATKNEIKEVGWAYFKHTMYNHIFSLCKKFTPDNVILCVDSKENWRKKFYPEYKQNRKEMRDNNEEINWNDFFQSFQEFVDEVKRYFPFYVFQIKYLEADDIAAILAKNLQKYEKIIVTSDSDYLQLLQYKNVKIWDPMKTLWKTCDDPEKQLKIKILSGDDGDNIPSIKPRIGVKTAEKLVNNPQLLKEIFNDKTPAYIKQDGSVYTLGEQYIEQFKLNTILIDLNRIPPILIKLVKKEMKEYNLPLGNEIYSYLSKNKFREFLRRIEEIESIVKVILDGKRLSDEDYSIFFEEIEQTN